MATSYRVNRVSEGLHREFINIVQKLKDPRCRFVTVVDVDLSSDLKFAKMYVSVLGSEKEKTDAVAGLQHAVGHIRTQIAKQMSMRTAPDIRIIYDDTSEQALKISTIIDEAVSNVADPNE